MANDNEASFAKIGAFILFGVVLIAGVLAYLGGAGGEKREYLVETYFANDVTGLETGSAVNFRGVRVGVVKEISFIGAVYDSVKPNHARNIYVLLALDSKLCRMSANDNPSDFVRRLIDHGLHATVTASGITGLSHIEMNFPKSEIEDEKISWIPRHQLVPPAPSMFENFADGASKMMRQLTAMDIAPVWSNIVRITGTAADACENASGLLDSQRGQIVSILDNLNGAASSLKAFADEISGNPSLLLRARDSEPLPETR